MKPLKQYKKLQTLNVKAERCLSREEAQRLIRKADKAQRKLDFANYCGSIHKGQLGKN
tara:strand:+ start:91 stop:264 length:174 start_codon:yes stop_codon:yes gene_type:complete